MSSHVFYRKWRPQTLADVVGQEPTTRTLSNALRSGRISHAYLFCGPRGTGKTSTARILAKAVNCTSGNSGEPCNTCAMCRAITEARSMDVIEIDAASNTGVDDIRDLREKVIYSPSEARYKVYIIDEVHMLSNSASNALLKTLEEPPPHVIFILATTEVHKILPTILSRCQRFDFRRLSLADVAGKLEQVCKAEGISIEPDALRLIARSATGSLRDAENILQQLTTYYGAEVSLPQVQSVLGITGDRRVKELVRHIFSHDVSAGIATINAVNNDGLDLRQFNRELVEYLRELLLVKTGAAESLGLTAEDLAELKSIAAGVSLEKVLQATRLFGQLELGLDSYSTLPIELALVECSLDAREDRDTMTKQDVAVTTSPPKEMRAAGAPEQVRRSVTEPSVKAAPPSAGRAVTPQPISTPSAPESRPQPVRKPEPVPVSAAPMAEPAVAETLVSALEGGSEIERLKINWKQVIKLAPIDLQKSRAVAMLRSADIKPIAIENDIVSLSFKQVFYKEQIEKIENQRVTEKIISNYLGRPCRIRCVLESNHLVKAALKIGAQIVEEK